MFKAIPPIALAICVLLPTPFLRAATFHPVSSVTSSTAASDLYAVGNLIQGPGTGFASGAPHDSLGGGSTHTWVTANPNGSGDYYANGMLDPVLVFDLGADRQLSEISTWGYANSNTNGAKDFSLRFATSAEGSGGFGTSISYNPTFEAAFSATTRDSHSFSQTVTARYVEMRITDNWGGMQGGTPGGDRVGLGEVAFADQVPALDPVIQIPPSLNLDLDGSVQTIDVAVSNLGATQTLTLGTPTFAGTHASAFSVLSNPAAIAPGENDLIQLSFNPTGLSGSISATMTVTSNAANASTSQVALGGFLHDPKLVVAGALDLGTFPSASGVQSTSLAIANGGGGQTLTISSTNLTGSHAANFVVTSTPGSLAPLGDGIIALDFDPQGSEGNFSARLEITTNDAVTPLRIVNLSARVGDAIPNSGVRINEFMASNGMTLDDGDGQSSDWIEIYNAGPGPVDLSGWHLTDSAGNLDKWEFPAGTTLNENDYLLVFASGQLVDDYIDAGGFLHTNFKLTTDGEYLALVRPDGETVVSQFSPAFPVQFNDVSYGSYLSGGSSTDLIATSDADILVPTDGSLGLTWTFEAFNPGAEWFTDWTGTGVGFDSNPNYLPFIDIDVEAEMRNNGTSAYIRIPFTVTDAASLTALALTIRYDDGFYAYLNSDEIANRNAPANPAWNSSTASSVDENNNLETIDVSEFLSSLQNGNNVLAIHGINQSANNGDFLIDPELIGTSGGLLQVGYLVQPTPGAANAGGVSNPGPEISSVSHDPPQPTASEDLVVTALVQPRVTPVANVLLQYRVQYGTLSRVAMRDDGTAPDALAGDGIYTTTIPASAYGAEDMVRWYIIASDTASATSRAPAFLDQTGKNQSPEHFGTVTLDPAVSSELPLFQWFTTSTSASHTRSGTRASVYFRGRFYDNVFVRQRGGATNGTASQKFDFNKGDNLYINEEMSSVGELNMNGNGSDGTYVRQPLAFEAYRTAGNASCFSELWQLRVNGGNDRVGIFIEQVDEDFLERNGYDQDGDLYKFVQRSNLNPVFFDTVTGIEKKTGDQSDLRTVRALVAGLNQATSTDRRNWVIDNLDLSQVYNYLAVRSITQDADDVRKNFYMFNDARGDGRWRIFPWDKDWTFGVTGDGGTHLAHPFFGDQEHAKQNANQWNVLYDVLFEEEITQLAYLRRLRTVMDEVLQPASTSRPDRYFDTRARQIIAPASPPLSNNVSAIDNYLNSRRNVLFNNYPSLIPGPEPANPDVSIASVDYNPASTNQDEEYICLRNTETTEIDLSGWSIEGGVAFTFAPGTVIGRGGNLYLSPDTKAFRNRSSAPTGNQGRVAVGPYAGHLSNFSETLTLKDENGVVRDTFVTPDDPSEAQRYLVISEVMYHPADPNDDAEFIELLNISESVTLDLNGVHFSAGVDFTFGPGDSLPPGERILVVFDQAAFEAVHGSGLNVAGEFLNGSRLNNGSDHLVLDDATNSTIADFTYNDNFPWPREADGGGFSLVLVHPAARPDADSPSNWRGSAMINGNPGTSDSSLLVGNATDNQDGDELNALLEHVFGTSDLVQNKAPIEITTTAGGRLRVTVQLNQSADDVRASLEKSAELFTWEDAATDLLLLSRTNHGDGTATIVFESAVGFLATRPRLFLRIVAELVP